MKKLVCSALILSMLIADVSVTSLAAESADSGVSVSIQETAGADETEAADEAETSGTQEELEVEAVSDMQEVSGDVENSDAQETQTQTELKENSWRYSDGELIIGNEPAAYSLDAWTKVDGYFVNDVGEIIPNAVKKGVDVSHHQGEIDWEAVKNSDIEFVIIRCGYGDNYTSQDDRQWLRNVQECERLGIPYGVYLYSYATTTANARSEAAHVLRLLEGHNPSYPVYYDMEDDSTLDSRAQFAEFADIFCSAVEAAGYEAGVYANLNWWNTYLTDTRFSQWDRWVAQYNSQCSYQGEYSIWQCTSSGTVPGIDGPADLNFLIGEIGYWEEINGNKYYYVDGDRIRNQGMKIDGYWYYFDNEGAAYCSRWREKGSDRYYYDAEGHMVSGKGLKIGDYWYYFEESGAMLRGWRDKGNDRYYYDVDGRMASEKGLKIDGSWYYFETSGAMLRGWRDKGNDRYYYDTDGRMVSGKGLKIGNYWYYFEGSGAMLRGWRDKGNDRYYYDAEGHMVLNQELTIGEYHYYFGESGAMYRGWRKNESGSYYYGSDGRMITGAGAKIDGCWYYFETNGAMLRGWRDKGSDRYYYDNEGHMVSGKGLKIDGYWYYFETNGAMLRGWRDKGTDRYYYDKNGRMLVDQPDVLIDGTLYSFDESGRVI